MSKERYKEVWTRSYWKEERFEVIETKLKYKKTCKTSMPKVNCRKSKREKCESVMCEKRVNKNPLIIRGLTRKGVQVM